ncbi:DUF3592 domain-containing protein [Streptomyces scopuliridis]|uniref:DUF3592 domain-containing protein n=2 Tax=Streptomyces scopuliridis TaxID=452529 RepID=A0ACD4ZX38_9ACTN|nr:DUF3592 domain-containing protein [Streptomyces scopuliridis]WSC03098.1 DUF3592 domain-containing protein [Streptomyces scopuliridis]WSC11026.1 DUF3592 domain-containing protein [Streptomyces scopuliridis]
MIAFRDPATGPGLAAFPGLPGVRRAGRGHHDQARLPVGPARRGRAADRRHGVRLPRHDLRLAGRDAARLDAAVAVPGRVVAVLTTDHDDGESARTSYAAVITFTTLRGTVVTARFRTEPKDPATAYGQEVTVHYAPDDPEMFTLDVAATRRSNAWGIAFVVVCLLLGAAATVTGAVLL